MFGSISGELLMNLSKKIAIAAITGIASKAIIKQFDVIEETLEKKKQKEEPVVVDAEEVE